VNRRSGVWLLALAAMIAAACGKKASPIAPELRLPVAPSALSGVVDDNAIVVTWTNPSTRFDGTPLKDLTEVRLHRREDSDGAPLKPAMLSRNGVVGYDQIASIRLDSPAPAVVRGSNVQWIDRQGLVLGHRYVYVATAVDGLGRSSPPSERRPITFLAAPRPPRDVEASVGDRRITLRWAAPAEFIDGNPVTGELRYLVLRGVGGEAMTPITPAPIAETSFTDAGLDNDTEYRYAVRGVRVDPRATVTGVASTVVAAVPVSTTPPTPPSNLVIVPSADTFRLAWNPSPSANVAAYAIYRAMGTGPLIRVATTLAGSTTFVDRDVRAGVTYRYAVTAIDNARTPNESARSNEVTVRAP
jgi:hypothetical protein